MVKKKPVDDLFDVDYQEDKREKLPTLQQYVKLNATAENTVSDVDIIWYPGKFRNFTIQTGILRASVQPANRLFNPLKSRIDEILTYDSGISLTITQRKPISFRLSRNEIIGRWEAIGDAGVKFVPADEEGLDDEPW